MEFFDTHCHIHFDSYELDAETVLADAKSAGVTRMIAVGCTPKDSEQGVTFAKEHDGVWASVGIHPHEADTYASDNAADKLLRYLAQSDEVVAIGECGLDYYYEHATRDAQIALFEQQLQIADDNDLPVIFHVRDAFDDFLPVFDNFSHLKGIVHSFTAGRKVLDKLLARNLYIGLNGIMTFTKDQAQLDMAAHVPLDSLVLETDAPFLTPKPFRGTICEPRYVVETGKFLAGIRDESIEDIAAATTRNAHTVFKVN